VHLQGDGAGLRCEQRRAEGGDDAALGLDCEAVSRIMKLSGAARGGRAVRLQVRNERATRESRQNSF
jgi:hypothetical protein